jgi:hypothetical protein
LGGRGQGGAAAVTAVYGGGAGSVRVVARVGGGAKG